MYSEIKSQNKTWYHDWCYNKILPEEMLLILDSALNPNVFFFSLNKFLVSLTLASLRNETNLHLLSSLLQLQKICIVFETSLYYQIETFAPFIDPRIFIGREFISKLNRKKKFHVITFNKFP